MTTIITNRFTLLTCGKYSDFQASCNGKPKSVERHLHTLMCSVSVVTVVFIYTMEDDQRLNTLVHEGDALRFSVYHCKKPENRCSLLAYILMSAP